MRPHNVRSIRGTTSLELLVCLPVLLLVFLGLMQKAILLHAELVIERMAARLVRSAIVVAHDDPKFYESAPRGDFTARGPRHQKLTEAARLLAAPLRPASEISARDTLADAVEAPTASALFAAAGLGVDRALVSVESVAGSPLVGARDAIQIRLDYFVPCLVPLARTLLCEDLIAFRADGATTKRIEQFSPSPSLLWSALGLRRHVRVTKTATLTNHGASYFPGEGKR